MRTSPTTNPPRTPAAHDYTHVMRVHASPQDVIAAVSDGDRICRWWTAATRSERHGDDVRLYRDGAPFIFFTFDRATGTGTGAGAGEVTWTVTTCVMDDWVGTVPSFSVREDGAGTCVVEFRHVGLRPELECFDQCRAGWNHFMPSLQQFVETGTGRPNQPRDPSA